MNLSQGGMTDNSNDDGVPPVYGYTDKYKLNQNAISLKNV